MPGDLTIGEVAKLAGVSVETIRFYQRRGLLTEPEKPFRGIRRYPAEAARRIRFIKRAQGLGLTLKEVSELLGFERASVCAETRALAARKVELLDKKMADWTAMRKVLVRLIQDCDAGESGARCPIIEVLDRE